MADKPPKKSKRVSMKGMGADAFFGLPAEEKEEPVSQDESMQVDQQADKIEHQSTILPANQQSSTPVEQQASVPSSQEAIIPSNQNTDVLVSQGDVKTVEQKSSTPLSQYASMPVSSPSNAQIEGQHTDIPPSQQHSSTANQRTGIPVRQDLMKATYYIYPDQDLKLERIRLARRMRGEKVDKSELIREAIDRLEG